MIRRDRSLRTKLIHLSKSRRVMLSSSAIRCWINALSALDAHIVGLFAGSNEFAGHAANEDCRIGVGQFPNHIVETVLLEEEETFFRRIAYTANNTQQVEPDCRLIVAEFLAKGLEKLLAK